MLEGSVRRQDEQLRINARLVDTTTGGQLWAERYDDSMSNVFELQDKVSAAIVGSLALSLGLTTPSSQPAAETRDQLAYDAFLKGWEQYRLGTPSGLQQAIPLFETATRHDRGYARAHAALAATYWRIYANRWYESVLGVGYAFPALEAARDHLREARKSPTPLAHQVAAEISAYLDEGAEAAIAGDEARRAVELDPNAPASRLAMAMASLKYGKAGQAHAQVREAMRLDPIYPPSYLVLLAKAEFDMGRYQDAASTLQKALDRGADTHRTYAYLAASLAHLGRDSDARAAVNAANALRRKAGWGRRSLASVDALLWIGDASQLREGLRKASVPAELDDWSQLIDTEAAAQGGTPVDGATRIDAVRARTLHAMNVPFVDVSTPWYEEHIPGSTFLMVWFNGEHTEFNDVRLERLARRDEPLVIYSSGLERRAVNATAMAVSWGWSEVFYFERSLRNWKAAGLSTARGAP